MHLYPEEALILFIRMGTGNPSEYIVDVRACQTAFDENKDLKLVGLQRAVSSASRHADLREALNTAVKTLEAIASGSIPP